MFESVFPGSLPKPAFNDDLKDASTWGVPALERAARSLTCTTAVHLCSGYGIKANMNCKEALSQAWQQYQAIFPALAKLLALAAGAALARGRIV